MNWIRLSLGPLGTNCYICWKGNQALVMDPGEDAGKIIEVCREQQIRPLGILLTHAHFDHIGAVDAIRDHYSIPVFLHREEWGWMQDPMLNGSALFPLAEVRAGQADKEIKAGDFSIGEFQLEVRHTPGHSPGSVSFIDHKAKLAFSGDVLFQQGIGRTDLPGGDMDTLLRVIENQLYTLGDEYKVLPGHGPVTSIGKEKDMNPFVKG